MFNWLRDLCLGAEKARMRAWEVDVVLGSGESRVMYALGADETEALDDWLYRLSVWRDHLIITSDSGWSSSARIVSWRIRPEQEETK